MIHIITCCKEMVEVAHNDMFHIYFFDRSLKEAALKRYMQLDNSRIKT